MFSSSHKQVVTDSNLGCDQNLQVPPVLLQHQGIPTVSFHSLHFLCNLTPFSAQFTVRASTSLTLPCRVRFHLTQSKLQLLLSRMTLLNFFCKYILIAIPMLDTAIMRIQSMLEEFTASEKQLQTKKIIIMKKKVSLLLNQHSDLIQTVTSNCNNC